MSEKKHKRARAKKALRTASAVGIVLGGAILDPNNVVLAAELEELESQTVEVTRAMSELEETTTRQESAEVKVSEAPSESGAPET